MARWPSPAMGEWLAKRCTRLADAVMVSAGIACGLLVALWLVGAHPRDVRQATIDRCQRSVSTLEAPDCLDTHLARVRRYEVQAADTLGPIDWNATTYPQENGR